MHLAAAADEPDYPARWQALIAARGYAMLTAADLEPLFPAGIEPALLPRELAWQNYRVLAAGSAEAARLLAEELLAILRGQRGDEIAPLVEAINALGVIHEQLEAAAHGLVAVRGAQGIA